MSKVLIIDDDRSLLRNLQNSLVNEGYEVITASNGLEGLWTAQEKLPDLIVLDVMLPGLDGFEVCNRLREGSTTVKIPILMLSANKQDIDKITALKVGADVYMNKPFDKNEFLKVSGRLLSQSKIKS